MWPSYSKCQRVEQQICIEFCVKLEHPPEETILKIEKATTMGNWWLAASSWQCTRSCILSHADSFGEISNHLGDSSSIQPRFGTLWLLAFPKTRITFEKEEISDCWWDQENVTGQLRAIGRTVLGPKVPTLKGIEASLPYVQCSCIFFSKCLYFSYYMAGYFLDTHTYFKLVKGK